MLELVFDVDERTIVPVPGGTSALPADETAAIVEGLAKPEMQERLLLRWTRVRGQDEPGRRPEGWKPGMLAAYTEVFPSGWDLVVERGDKLILALDQYCLSPGCACSDLAVQFVRLEDGSDAGTAFASLPAKPEARVSDRADVRALWRALLETTPPGTLRRRFRRIRGLSKSLLPEIAPRRGRPTQCAQSSAAASELAYLLRAHVRNTEPAVWRRLEASGAMHLSEVVQAVYRAFGWSNGSVARLRPVVAQHGAYRRTTGQPFDLKVPLALAAPSAGALWELAEPGDDPWEVEILVESVEAARPGTAARLVDGEAPAPPGPTGAGAYHDQVHAFYAPDDPDHEAAVAALGEAFDPELLPDALAVPRPAASTDVPVDARDIGPLLERTGALLMQRTRARVVELGGAAFEVLNAIVSEALERVAAEPDPSWPLVHAVDLLGRLGHEPAVAPLLRVIETVPADSPLQWTAQLALQDIGPACLEPTLSAYARQADPRRRASLREALASLGIADPRILELLLEALHAGEPASVPQLAAYGDSAAIPALQAVLREALAGRGPVPREQADIVFDIAMTIEDLGGEIRPNEEAKLQALRVEEQKKPATLRKRATQVTSAPNVATAPRKKPGRNDPCWCGSGRKYKKCHLTDDERAARTVS